ncbi:MAG: hypothetical protein ACUVX8_02455 [Candidatus Zipacnadales bacterium]
MLDLPSANRYVQMRSPGSPKRGLTITCGGLVGLMVSLALAVNIFAPWLRP